MPQKAPDLWLNWGKNKNWLSSSKPRALFQFYGGTTL